MAWVSLTVLRLEREQMDAQRLAEVQQRVRLALWRMDSALIPLLTSENARPGYTYWSEYPAGTPTAVYGGGGWAPTLQRSSPLRELPPG